MGSVLSALLMGTVVVLGLLTIKSGAIDITQTTTPRVVAPKGEAQLFLTVNAKLRADAGADIEPLPDARVRLLLPDDQERYLEAGSGRTDAQGRLTLEDLPAGAAWLLVDADGYRRVSRPVQLFSTHHVEVQLSLGQALKVTVVDEEDKPLAGTTVLVRDDDALPFGGLTDAKGERSFGRLGSAPWRVEVFARGYESAQRDGVSTDQRIMLRRLGSLRVHVVDTDGDPAEGAHVFIVGSALWPARRALTDDKGDCVVSGLLPGVYNLKAELGGKVSPEVSGVALERAEHRRVDLRLMDGRVVRVFAVDTSPGYDEPVEGANVVLAEYGLSSFPVSATTGKDGMAYLSPAPWGASSVSVSAEGFVPRSAVAVPADGSEPVRVELLKGATLFGEVTDPAGRPIDGARVEVIGTDVDGLPIDATPLLTAYRDAHFEWSLQPLPLLEGGELGVTLGPVPFVNEALSGQSWTTLPADYNPWITDFEGDFRAFPVPPGRVRALVRHPAYVEGLSDEVVLGPGGEAHVKVVLSPGGELLGRVVDENDRPVPFARVRVSAVYGSFESTSYALEDGTFKFAAVPADVTVMVARPDDPTRFVTRERVRIDAGKSKDQEFVLPEARQALELSVVDLEGVPIELAQIQLTSLEPAVPLRTTLFSDATGKVLLEDSVGLRTRLSVSAPGFLQLNKELRRTPTELTVKLQRGISISGRVTAVRGRLEVDGDEVVLEAGGQQQTRYTDALGRYTFDNVPVGRVTLNVSHDDYAKAERSVRVESTGRLDRAFDIDDIDLAEAATLSGMVVDRDGEPVQGARVGLGFAPTFLVMGRLPEGFVLTDEEGRFELASVAPGEASVSAYADAVGRGQLQLTVEEGQDRNDLLLSLDDPPEDDAVNLSGGGLALTLGERDTADGVVVVIVDIASGSEAAHAGLRAGDEVVSIDGLRAEDMGAARRMLNGRVGSDVVIAVSRGGATTSFRVRREPTGR